MWTGDGLAAQSQETAHAPLVHFGDQLRLTQPTQALRYDSPAIVRSQETGELAASENRRQNSIENAAATLPGGDKNCGGENAIV